MKTSPFLLTLLLILLFGNTVSAQQKNDNYLKHQTMGLLLGTRYVDEHLPEGTNYHPIKFIINYKLPLRKAEKIKKGVFIIQFEPQFNFILINGGDNAIETGINVGFQYEYLVGKNNIIFGGFGSGPHFITVETNLQANGFIFSDNFILGYRQRILNEKSPFEINIQTRFRHISNAGLQEPNLGIDNFFILIGISTIIE